MNIHGVWQAINIHGVWQAIHFGFNLSTSRNYELTYKCSQHERHVINAYYGWSDVDKPIWEEWGNSEEYHVIEHVFSMPIHLTNKQLGSYTLRLDTCM